jgi:amino acid adenylation domain-containing protein
VKLSDRVKLVTLLRKKGKSNFAKQIEPRPKGDSTASLSLGQERLWVLDHLGGAGDAYRDRPILRVEGRLDVPVLQRALSALAERHETLRTRFVVANSEPLQVVEPIPDFPFTVEDLSGLPEADRPGAAHSSWLRFAKAPFDFERGPLFRVAVLKFTEHRYWIAIVLHQIISDGWSLGIIFRELSSIYSAFLEGKPHQLPPLEVQYADYAIWQRDRVNEEGQLHRVNGWIDQLRGAPTALELPTDRPRPRVASYAGDDVVFALGTKLSHALEQIAAEEGATLYMVLLAGYSILLSRYSGERELVIGSPTAGRLRPEIEGLIGFFVNTLVLRVGVDDSESFSQLLARVKNVALSAQDHQEVPFEKLVGELQPRRDLSRHPLFQTLFSLQNLPEWKIALPGAEVELISGPLGTTKLDLSLVASESAAGLKCRFEYATAIFDRGSIERMRDHLIGLLKWVIENPTTAMKAHSLVNSAEREQLLRQWNSTAHELAGCRGVHDLIVLQALRTPSAAALKCGARTVSYAELDHKSTEVACGLLRAGAGQERSVGICMQPSADHVIAMLGIMKAGCAYVPLDPALPKERLSLMIEDSRMTLLIADSRSIDNVPQELPLTVLRAGGDWQCSHAGEALPSVDPDSLAYVIYTSGSTGRPKGVAATHRATVNRLSAQAEIFPWQPGDVGCQKTAIGFVDSISEILCPLSAGALLVIAPEDVSKDAVALVRFIDSNAISRLLTVPSLAQAILSIRDAREHLRSLHSWTLSGEVLSSETLSSLREMFPRCQFINLYGSSEVGADVTYFLAGAETVERVPIGRPLWNVRAMVLDQNLQVVPTGIVAELCISGDALARGYLHRPGLTAERFIADPYGAPGSRMFRTGDTARTSASGELYYVGRTDHQVKIRGHRVELGEVENALLRCAPVTQCAVVAREEEGHPARLVAYVAGANVSEHLAEVRRRLQLWLPEYMLPSLYVALDRLPLTFSGKVSRRDLPPPPAESADARKSTDSDLLTTESALVGIWQRVLGTKGVGVDDNFFQLGGDSLRGIRVISDVQTELGFDLALTDLFKHGTVRELAAYIGQAKSAPPVAQKARFEEGAI